MKQPTLARTLCWAVPALGAALFALLLAACTLPAPVRPPPGWSPLPTPPPPLAGRVNPALVGFYRGSALLHRPAAGAEFTTVVTITLSLFQDGAFEQTFASVSDLGTHTVADGLQRVAGRWADQGDVAVLADHLGTYSTFMTIGGDALALTPARPATGAPTWVLTRVSAAPQHYFAASVRDAVRVSWEYNRGAVVPELAGVYRSGVQLMPETGNAVLTLQLFPNGWAELAFDRVEETGDATDRWVSWGLWSAGVYPADAVTFDLYGTQDSSGAAQAVAGPPSPHTFRRDGETLTQVDPAWGFVLTRTADLPVPLLPELFPSLP